MEDDYRRFRQAFLKDMVEHVDVAEAAILPIGIVEQIISTVASQMMLPSDTSRGWDHYVMLYYANMSSSAATISSKEARHAEPITQESTI